MPYVGSRIRTLSHSSCIFYALSSAIWMTNAVNFCRFEEPVIHLEHDSSVHLMRRHHKHSQLLFYKCVRAKRLNNLKYLCFRSYWAAHRLDQEDLSLCLTLFFSFPVATFLFLFFRLSLFTCFFPNTIPSTPRVPVFSRSEKKQEKK